MTADTLFDAPAARPAWLVTLADLSLLLVGFFVLLQAHQGEDRRKLTRGIAAAFGVEHPPLPVAAASVRFAPGSAMVQAPETAIAFARDALRDPRVSIAIAGATDGSVQDREPGTGSAALLAADRARALAAALAAAGVPTDRLTLTTAAPAARARTATVTLAFAGEEGARR